MRLTREEFKKALSNYERMYREEGDIFMALDISPEWVPGNWIGHYYEFLTDMCDAPEHNYIGTILDWYCFELDFGSDWKPGYYTIDGVDIPLDTPDHLYDALLEDKPDND